MTFAVRPRPRVHRLYPLRPSTRNEQTFTYCFGDCVLAFVVRSGHTVGREIDSGVRRTPFRQVETVPVQAVEAGRGRSVHSCNSRWRHRGRDP